MSDEVKLEGKMAEFVDWIETISVLELSQLVKALVRRPRPDTAAPLITAEGWAYPSSHMVAITVLAIMVISAMVVTRRRRTSIVLASTGLVLLWWLVFADRWWLRAHWGRAFEVVSLRDGRASGDSFHAGPGDRDFFRFVQDKELAVGSTAENAVSGVQLPGDLPR